MPRLSPKLEKFHRSSGEAFLRDQTTRGSVLSVTLRADRAGQLSPATTTTSGTGPVPESAQTRVAYHPEIWFVMMQQIREIQGKHHDEIGEGLLGNDPGALDR